MNIEKLDETIKQNSKLPDSIVQNMNIDGKCEGIQLNGLPYFYDNPTGYKLTAITINGEKTVLYCGKNEAEGVMRFLKEFDPSVKFTITSF